VSLRASARSGSLMQYAPRSCAPAPGGWGLLGER
jgi:hypothetical protein